MPHLLTSPLPSGRSLPQAPFRWRRAKSLDEVDAWEDAWRALDRRVENPLSHFSWTQAFLRVFGRDVHPALFGATRGDELVAVAPLVKKRQHAVCRLFLASVGELYEPMDLVWSDERALERLIARLALGGTPLFFERMFADAPGIKKIKRAYRGRAITIVRPQASCPYIALDDTWLEPETHLNPGRRGDLRRARRKAEELGPVTTEIRTPDLSELSQLLDTAFEVEASNWKGEAGTALVHDAHRAAFYRHYSEAACEEGILRVCFLRIGDRVAAMQLAIEDDRGFWLLKVGYDARFARCSPGTLLMRDTISYAAEAGLQSYEFLGRAETWTQMWTTTERACVSVRVYPFGVRGLAALAADGAVALWKKRSKKPCD